MSMMGFLVPSSKVSSRPIQRANNTVQRLECSTSTLSTSQRTWLVETEVASVVLFGVGGAEFPATPEFVDDDEDMIKVRQFRKFCWREMWWGLFF